MLTHVATPDLVFSSSYSSWNLCCEAEQASFVCNLLPRTPDSQVSDAWVSPIHRRDDKGRKKRRMLKKRRGLLRELAKLEAR